VQAYALYTLRLAGELSDDEARADLYSEAAELLLRLGDIDGAAAALRTALQSRPLDAAAFAELHPLLTRRAEEAGDPGPLLELLNFRLAQAPRDASDEALRRGEQLLRVPLLLQRAGLLRQSGQDLDAENDLRALLQLEPGHALAHRWLAELRAQYADAEAAIHHYERFLQLDAKPAERQVVHAAVAKLLAPTEPARAAAHVRQAIEFGERYRALRGDEVDTLEEVRSQIELHRWLSELQLQLKQPADAVATLRELLGKLPTDTAFAEERQRVSLVLAEVLEHHAADRAAALVVVEQVLKETPAALPALERLIALVKLTAEPTRAQLALGKAAGEARRRVSAMTSADGKLDPALLQALGQIFTWQGLGDLPSLASQAATLVRAATGQPSVAGLSAPALKIPGRSVGPPLRTVAYPAEARGILSELWTEVADSANRVLGSELTALGAQPKERLNAKEVPPSWATVDQLANRFGLGSGGMTLAYGLFLGRDKDQCQLAGNNLVCGSHYATPLASLPPALFFRLARRLALLPDRMGPLEVEPHDMVLFIAACCGVAQLPGPTLAADQKARLDERTRALERVISRKERSAIKGLAARLTPVAGSEGKDFIVGWQQAVLLGGAQLALAITGNLAAALDDLGVSLRDGSAVAVRKARALCAFSVSAEMQSLRRELGLSE
jgi:tetratricopeptide (TPR) repeat protein